MSSEDITLGAVCAETHIWVCDWAAGGQRNECVMLVVVERGAGTRAETYIPSDHNVEYPGTAQTNRINNPAIFAYNGPLLWLSRRSISSSIITQYSVPGLRGYSLPCVGKTNGRQLSPPSEALTESNHR